MTLHLQMHGASATCLWLTEAWGGERDGSLELLYPWKWWKVHSLHHEWTILHFLCVPFPGSFNFIVTHSQSELHSSQPACLSSLVIFIAIAYPSRSFLLFPSTIPAPSLSWTFSTPLRPQLSLQQPPPSVLPCFQPLISLHLLLNAFNIPLFQPYKYMPLPPPPPQFKPRTSSAVFAKTSTNSLQPPSCSLLPSPCRIPHTPYFFFFSLSPLLPLLISVLHFFCAAITLLHISLWSKYQTQ